MEAKSELLEKGSPVVKRERDNPAIESQYQVWGKTKIMEPCYSSFDGENLNNVELSEKLDDTHSDSWERNMKISCWTHWHAIIFGQLLSVALTVASATSLQLYESSNASAPTFSLLCMYSLLGLIHFSYWLRRKRQEWQDAVTAVLISDLTAVDCSYDDAYITTSDERHRVHNFSLHRPKDIQNNTSIMMILEQTEADLESEVEAHMPVSRYKFIYFSSVLTLHSCSWKQYCALALLHVEGNYCLLKSFQFESFKTVVLLQSISIPAAMITSALFLRRKYRWLHILGAFFCIAGSAITFRDSFSDYSTLYPNPIIGDLLAIISAILSGISDVFAEQAVKCKGSVVEYLAMIGFFGTIISFIQVLLLEPHKVLNLLSRCVECTESESEPSLAARLFLLSIFTVFSYMYYAGMSRFLLFSEAAFLNLSMLSSDLWSLVFSIFQEGVLPSPEFFVSFITIAAGVFAYQKAPSPIVKDKDGQIEIEDNVRIEELSTTWGT
jgi:drug/metabolite transporter (DMT)-like permease